MGERVLLNGEDVTEQIRAPLVTAAVSIVAAHPPGARRACRSPEGMGGSQRGGVVEGRDIGSVVLPDADVKIFLTADSAERAWRRAAENETGRTPPRGRTPSRGQPSRSGDATSSTRPGRRPPL